MGIGFFGLVAALSTSAQAEPTVTVDGHGSVVNTQGAVLWLVTGTVSGLNPAATYSVMAHTTQANVNLNAAGTDGTWSAMINVQGSANQDIYAPYRHWFEDKPRVFLPVLAELSDDSNGLISRNRALFYNIAGAQSLDPYRPNGGIFESASQLTPAGLTDLELIHEQLIPMPDLLAFQDDLDTAIPGVARNSFSPSEVCVPMPEDADWEALIDGPVGLGARTYHAIYVGANNAAQVAGPNQALYEAVAEAQCVRHAPSPSDYEICVGSVELELTDATVEDVLPPTLTFQPASNELLAEPSLTVTGKSTARLRSLQFKWTPAPLPCFMGPTPYNYADADISSEPFLDSYTTCPQADLALAQVDGYGLYSFLPLPGTELLEWLHMVGSGLFSYPASSSISMPGGCPEAAFDTAVQEGFETFQDLVVHALEHTWYPSATNHEADALALLLESYEVGTSPVSTYDFKTRFDAVISNDVAGVMLTYGTEADTLDPLVTQPSDYLWHPASPIQNYPQAIDENGGGFDVMYSFTIGSLNQMLRARSVDERFDGFTLTFADVEGLPQPVDPTLPGEWTTQELADLFDPITEADAYDAILNRGDFLYSFQVKPTLSPFTFMDPDPQGVPSGLHSLTYQLGQYQVQLVDDTGTAVYRMYVDLYEPDVSVTTEPSFLNVLLDPSTSSEWTWTPVDPLDISKCTRGDLDTLVGCDAQIRDKLIQKLKPFIDSLVWDLISEAPAPQIFDRRELTMPVGATSGLVWKDFQRITIFAEL